MARRLHALYLRYATVHADRLFSVPIGPLRRRWGQVERVLRRDRLIVISGWVHAARLRLTWPGGEVDCAPDIPRADVMQRYGGTLDCGFQLSAPIEATDLTLWVERDGMAPVPVRIHHPSDAPTPAARWRLSRAFARDLARALPHLIRYRLAPSDRTKARVKAALKLDADSHGHLLEAGWFAPTRTAAARDDPVTIILPVHNALDLLRDCLARVAAHTDLPWTLIAVEDASTDPKLRPWLLQWAADRADQATVVTLDRNLGFIGAANEGLRLAETRGGAGAVVLLNSDAMVPDGWASRLTELFEDPDVASVTPMSNAAEILSVPTIGPGLALRAGEGDALDAVARTFAPMPAPDLPTGVGFCMAISRRWLARVPRLDPAFGRGYGEEVDWCRKTSALGGRHLCQPRVFVEHVGGQSFSSAEKAERVRAGNALISRRYPAYDAAVQSFIAGDPLVTPRMALAIALAGMRSERLPIFVAHSLGGGAEVALMQEVAARSVAVVLRVGGRLRWRIEVHFSGHSVVGETGDLDLVGKMLAPVASLCLVYSCGVGDRDAATLPDALLSLRRPDHPDTVEMRIHDYFPLSPSYTLMGRDGFSGLPDSGATDPAHRFRRPDGTEVPLRDWRAAWSALVSAAAEVTVFSQSSHDLMAAAYPSARLRLQPHPMPHSVRKVRPGQPGCYGVLGNLNRHKGALVVRQIALANPAARFVVIGLVDSTVSLPRNVKIHGAYLAEDIADLTERHGISAWLMPAIWPETFSFTTREALATGLPVAGFALGAQGEVLEQAANGLIVPMEPKSTMAARLFDALRDAVSTADGGAGRP